MDAVAGDPALRRVHDRSAALRADLGSFTTINAIGVLTKLEQHWPEDAAMEAGRRVAGRNAEQPRLRRLLYRVLRCVACWPRPPSRWARTTWRRGSS